METPRPAPATPTAQPVGFAETFARETSELLTARLRLGLKVGILLYFLFAGLDVLVGGEKWPRLVAVRFGSVAIGLLGLWLAYRDWGVRHVKPLSVVIMAIGAFGISLMTALWDGFHSQYYVGNMLAIFLVGLFFPWGAATTALYGALVVLPYLALNFVVHDQGPLAATMPFFFLSGTAVLTTWASSVVERARSEALRMRMQIEEANVALKSLDEAKTKFFSSVSHELRTPLMLILGPLETLLEGKEENPRPLLQAMSTNAHRLLREVNQLLNFSKIDAGKAVVNRDAGDLAALLREMLLGAQPYARSHQLQLRGEGLDAPITFAFDVEKIENVAQNLLSNAIKFTPAGGAITIRAGANAERAWFEVQDTGAGIPEDQQGKLFKPFAQVDGGRNGKVQGTGLGLATVKEYAELHGGSVTLRSQVGAGTTFRVELPNLDATTLLDQGKARTTGAPGGLATAFADLAAPSLDENVAEDATDDGAGATIVGDAAPDAPRLLLVEDNPNMRAMVAGRLAKRWRVTIARDGEEGLAAARRTRPDMIVSDVMMPRMNGFQMVEELRKDRAFDQTPILFLTARTGSEATLQGLALGAVDYVNKPFQQRELEARIEAQLRLRAAERSLAERDSRLLAIGQRTGQIAHDMRSPLATAIGRVEILRMTSEIGGGVATQCGDDLDVIERSMNRIEVMVQEMLEFVRGGETSMNLKRVLPADLVQEVVTERASIFAASGVQLVTAFQGDAEARVWLDAHHMRGVLENLLNNARDALQATHAAAPGATADAPRVRLILAADAREVRIRVSDNGPGLPDELAGRLFEAFATHGKVGGTGLGLMICANVVRAHKGRIEAEAHGEDGGACFTITLPRANEG